LSARCGGSVDDKGEPLDATYDADDLSEQAADEMRGDVADFLESNASLIARAGLSPVQVGHDFWLTRNGHGAGFWDRGLGEVGDELTAMAKPYGGCDLYAGDDGRLYTL
jgi:hypothetical protein